VFISLIQRGFHKNISQQGFPAELMTHGNTYVVWVFCQLYDSGFHLTMFAASPVDKPDQAAVFSTMSLEMFI
jgi:hypothetical protein